jgi:dephospho-CoA kinase
VSTFASLDATLVVDVGFVLFGLTGGLASGKSSVANRWRERRLPVIDADEIARLVVAPGTSGLDEVVGVFGPDVRKTDGTLDRKRLSALVFANPAARAKLEAITHPRITAETRARASELATHEPLACYEASLLVERGIADAFRPLVVVTASEDTQIARAMARDGLSAEEARARMGAQLPTKTKEALADFVIQNDGDRARLVEQADDVLDAIFLRLGVDALRYPRPAG